MTRPQSVQDVFDAIRRHRLLEPGRLSAFADRQKPTDATSTLERLVSDGLLTAFQAGEVAGGRGEGLWLGNYRVLDRLGRGGMGSVFLAEHAVLGKKVAVKVLSDALRADPGARKRFVREARAAATLNHPNIVHVFDVDMAHDPPYLVMEYVDGVSLQAAVARGGTFALGEVATIAVQVADGLTQAAAVGLVHRDIKPANILVDRRGSVRILDLGIVRFALEDTHSQLPRADVIVGTLDYLAPEQAIDSSEVDIRADIYALGATLYFLLTGHPPYPGNDLRWKLAAKQNSDPHPLHQLRPDLPNEFALAVHRLMARDPAARYSTPAMVVAALHPWATPGPDFPGRLFRFTSDSTANDRRLTAHEPANDPLPDTLRIIKTARRVGAAPTAGASAVPAAERAEPPPAPATDAESELGADTEGGEADYASALCDLEILQSSPESPAISAHPPPNEPTPEELEGSGTAPGFTSPLAPPRVARAIPGRLVPPPRLPARGRSVLHLLGLVVAILAVAAGIVALVVFAGR